ncbi:MAG: hypothetical protein V4671_21585 [Armatimonadota bacterium]
MRRSTEAPSAARISMERIRLIMFVIRHIAGVCILVWVIVNAFRVQTTNMAYLIAAMTAVYAAFALYSGKKLYKRYQILQAKFRAGGVPVAR